MAYVNFNTISVLPNYDLVLDDRNNFNDAAFTTLVRQTVQGIQSSGEISEANQEIEVSTFLSGNKGGMVVIAGGHNYFIPTSGLWAFCKALSKELATTVIATSIHEDSVENNERVDCAKFYNGNLLWENIPPEEGECEDDNEGEEARTEEDRHIHVRPNFIRLHVMRENRPKPIWVRASEINQVEQTKTHTSVTLGTRADCLWVREEAADIMEVLEYPGLKP